ncbi:phage tail protein [Bacillus ndiopicus]|uniref:phage tail protein n=1 Tax=Bacillus ndiopicus TaxID=1347368 RepID=UPI000693D28B|nr:phage tail protein [Bacillus ndiopicus]
MTQYGTIITNIGLAQIANAQVTQQKVGLQYIALGDGNGSYYIPTANQSALVNEVWRGPVSNVTIDPANDNRIIIEGIIPASTGGFTIREIAVFDDQNQLIAVGQYPEKYKPQLSEGVSEETHIHFVIETNNADAVELSIDPTIIIASREYVDERVGAVSTNLVQLEEDFTAHKDNDNLSAHKIRNIEGLAEVLAEIGDMYEIQAIVEAIKTTTDATKVKLDAIDTHTNTINSNLNTANTNMNTVNANLGIPSTAANNSITANAHAKLNWLTNNLNNIKTGLERPRTVMTYKNSSHAIVSTTSGIVLQELTNKQAITHLNIVGKGRILALYGSSPETTGVYCISIDGVKHFSFRGSDFIEIPFDKNLELTGTGVGGHYVFMIYELFT